MMEKGYIRSGQPGHFPIDQRMSITQKVKPKRKDRSCLFVLYALLLFVLCVGFIGFCYYLYERQNTEIQSFNEQISRLQNVEIQTLREKITYLNGEVDRLRKKVEGIGVPKQNGSANGMQSMLQESDSSKYKAIAIENVEEYPEIEDLDDQNLIANEEYNDDYTDEDTSAADIKTASKVSSPEQIAYNNYHPPSLTVASKISDNRTEETLAKIHRKKRGTRRRKRTADVVRVNGVNDIYERTLVHNRTATNDKKREDNEDKTSVDRNKTKESNILIKGTIISMPFEDFLEYFKNFQPNVKSKSFEDTMKKYQNCTMTMVNTFQQDNSLKQTRYNLKSGSSEEEEEQSKEPESLLTTLSDPSLMENDEPYTKIVRKRLRSRTKENTQSQHRPTRRKVQDNKNGRSGWKRQGDIEILSDFGNSAQTYPKQAASIIAAHFGGDSSKYSIQKHELYKGNGRLRHPDGKHKDWQPSSWFQTLNMDQHFSLEDGNLTVHRSGLYFVYAQIFYTDCYDVNGYMVMQNNMPVLQCITSTFSREDRKDILKSNSCFTGGVVKCEVGDVMSIKTVDYDRHAILEATKSFFGMFKIGDLSSRKADL